MKKARLTTAWLLLLLAVSVHTAFAQTLEFWGFADNRNKWYEAMAQEFKKIHPNVTINIRSFPYEEMHNRLLTALVAGIGAPDIADVEISRMGQFVKGGAVGFVPLNDLIGDEINNLYVASATAPWTWQGQIYGIGNELNAVLMFYRWDLYEKAGLANPGSTWEEFIENGKKLAATGVKTLAIDDQGWSYWWIIASAGNGFFDADGNVSADNEFGRRTMQLLYDMLHTYEIAMFAPRDAAYYGAMQQDAFAVHLGAPWYQGFMKDNAASLAGKWMLQPLPLFADGSGAPTATFGGTGTVITRQSKYPQIAWEFIKFANLTVDGQLLAFDMANLFPTYMPAWSDDRLYRTDDYFSGQRPAAIIREVAPKIPPLHNSPYWPEVTDAFTRLVVTPVLQKTATMDQAFAEFRREVDRIMR